MATDRTQKIAHNFLKQRFISEKNFTKNDLQSLTGWSDSSINTYWTKQFRTLISKASDGKYQVNESFRKFLNWDQFRLHVTQVRKVASDYLGSISCHIM